MDWVNRLRSAAGITDRQLASLERRRALRVRRKVPVIAVRSNNHQVPVVAVEFGTQGLRLETAIRLKRGERVALYCARKPMETFRGRAFGTDLSAPLASVRWTRYVRDRLSWEMGASFVVETDLQAAAVARFLLEECEVGIVEGREYRRAPRLTANMRGLLRLPTKETVEVSVRDLAVGGALLLVAQEVPRHTMVRAEVVLSDDAEPLVCRGMVVRCLPRGRDRYELGVAFTGVADDHKQRLVAHLSQLLRNSG
ncbi:MAG: PilZ domain-containing protein [Proteobacteria bacterium]|nr:PilZ domain-containing protein [Pseudomonadota bacterium]